MGNSWVGSRGCAKEEARGCQVPQLEEAFVSAIPFLRDAVRVHGNFRTWLHGKGRSSQQEGSDQNTQGGR